MYLSTGPNYSGSLKPDGTPAQHPDSFKPKYNDLNFPYDEDIFKRLVANGGILASGEWPVFQRFADLALLAIYDQVLMR